MKKKLLVVAITATLGLTGCMSTKVDPSAYQEVSMEKADIMPTKESLSGAKQKVVIFPADTSNAPLAKASNAGTTSSITLETYLAEVGVEIVDRTIAKKLMKEIQLAETKGKSEYEGPDVANFAVTGNISNASLTSKFYERSTWKDKKGKTHVTPAHCNFKATVSSNLKLYKLPSLSYSKTISANESTTLSTDTTNSNCPISNATAQSLIRKATQEGIRDNRTKFQNFFAPKAYVLARKTNDGKSLFKISAGENFGFVPESTITFYNLSVTKNPITGEISGEEYAVVEGTVTANLIGENFAWILVDDEKADKIKLGDYVKVKYEIGLLEGGIDLLDTGLDFLN